MGNGEGTSRFSPQLSAIQCQLADAVCDLSLIETAVEDMTDIPRRRDLFAAAALQQFLAFAFRRDGLSCGIEIPNLKLIARDAWTVAEVMCAADPLRIADPSAEVE